MEKPLCNVRSELFRPRNQLFFICPIMHVDAPMRSTCVKQYKMNLPGLLSVLPLRPPHNRTFDMRTRICFWQRDLLLLGHGLRLLAIGRLAWSSLTARFCLMRELARAAIFPPLSPLGGGSLAAQETLSELFAFISSAKI